MKQDDSWKDDPRNAPRSGQEFAASGSEIMQARSALKVAISSITQPTKPLKSSIRSSEDSREENEQIAPLIDNLRIWCEIQQSPKHVAAARKVVEALDKITDCINAVPACAKENVPASDADIDKIDELAGMLGTWQKRLVGTFRQDFNINFGRKIRVPIVTAEGIIRDFCAGTTSLADTLESVGQALHAERAEHSTFVAPTTKPNHPR